MLNNNIGTLKLCYQLQKPHYIVSSRKHDCSTIKCSAIMAAAAKEYMQKDHDQRPSCSTKGYSEIKMSQKEYERKQASVFVYELQKKSFANSKKEVLEECLVHLPNLLPRQLSRMLHSISDTGLPLPDLWCQRIQMSVHSTISDKRMQLDIETASSLLHALHRMDSLNEQIKLSFLKRFKAGGINEIIGKVHDFFPVRAEDSVRLLWVLATTETIPSETWLESFHNHLDQNVQWTQLQGSIITHVIWAASNLKLKLNMVSSGTESLLCNKKNPGTIARDEESNSADDLVILQLALRDQERDLSNMSYAPSPSPRWLEAALLPLMGKVRMLPLRSVASLLCSLYAFGYTPTKSRCSQLILEDISRRQNKSSVDDLLHIGHCFTEVRLSCDHQAWRLHTECVLKHIMQLELAQIIQMLWVFSSCDVTLRAVQLTEVAGRLSQLASAGDIQALSPLSLTKLLSSLARLYQRIPCLPLPLNLSSRLLNSVIATAPTMEPALLAACVSSLMLLRVGLPRDIIHDWFSLILGPASSQDTKPSAMGAMQDSNPLAMGAKQDMSALGVKQDKLQESGQGSQLSTLPQSKRVESFTQHQERSQLKPGRPTRRLFQPLTANPKEHMQPVSHVPMTGGNSSDSTSVSFLPLDTHHNSALQGGRVVDDGMVSTSLASLTGAISRHRNASRPLIAHMPADSPNLTTLTSDELAVPEKAEHHFLQQTVKLNSFISAASKIKHGQTRDTSTIDASEPICNSQPPPSLEPHKSRPSEPEHRQGPSSATDDSKPLFSSGNPSPAVVDEQSELSVELNSRTNAPHMFAQGPSGGTTNGSRNLFGSRTSLFAVTDERSRLEQPELPVKLNSSTTAPTMSEYGQGPSSCSVAGPKPLPDRGTPPSGLSLVQCTVAAARLGYQLCDTQLTRLLTWLAPQIDTLPYFAVADLLGALSMQQVALPGHVARLLISRSKATLERCSMGQLAEVLWGMAGLGLRPRAQWMVKFYRCSLPHLPKLSARDFCRLVWALGVLRHRPPSLWWARLIAASSRHLGKAQPGQLALLALGVSLLGTRLPSGWVSRFGEAANSALPLLDASGQVHLLWAWERLRLRAKLERQKREHPRLRLEKVRIGKYTWS